MSLKEKAQKKTVNHPLVWPNMIEERLYQLALATEATEELEQVDGVEDKKEENIQNKTDK